jgi:predicted pyridoxine 5'-phosphate oxidase superfamily flavin-nucleotide-binding protein
MAHAFLDIATTPSVKAAQEANGSRDMLERYPHDRSFKGLGEREAGLIATRDSFFMASVSETGWPYVQHRGGPAGFLKVLDDRTLAFADYRGNRQYITLGNTAANDRAALILMDYPHRARLKLYARLESQDLAADPDLAAKLAPPAGYRARPERAMILHVEAFDWNCQQHITPRYTEAEIAEALQPLRARLDALEAENRNLRARLVNISEQEASP